MRLRTGHTFQRTKNQVRRRAFYLKNHQKNVTNICKPPVKFWGKSACNDRVRNKVDHEAEPAQSNKDKDYPREKSEKISSKIGRDEHLETHCENL